MKNVRTLNESDSRSKILNDQCLRYQERIKQIIHFVTDKMDSKQKELNRIFIPSIIKALRPAYGEVSTIKGMIFNLRLKFVLKIKLNYYYF